MIVQYVFENPCLCSAIHFYTLGLIQVMFFNLCTTISHMHKRGIRDQMVCVIFNNIHWTEMIQCGLFGMLLILCTFEKRKSIIKGKESTWVFFWAFGDVWHIEVGDACWVCLQGKNICWPVNLHNFILYILT